jgi:DNA-binding response OmpR family regulator
MNLKHFKILVVDDDPNILRMIQLILELEGYDVTTASDGETAIQIFRKTGFSLVILDIMMSGTDGICVCKTIRQYSNIPIIMVTARGTVNEKLEGFEAGADDYVTKPFPTKELVARVSAVLRRSSFPENIDKSSTYKCKDMEIDFERKVATVNDKILDLTATEYRLLAYMANNPYRVITSETILREVWGAEYTNDVHLLQVNIGRLRQKIKKISKDITYIETKPSLGYIFNPD